jgi:tetraacyldisaccharide 4'-kinase
VVSVGNLTVGGTGKTPMAAWILGILESAGQSPALVSRGYAEDELLLHRRWHPDVPIVSDPDRVAATLRARDDGARVVVLDDGFQHRRLARDVDIVLVAAEDPWPGRLLPRGPYREPPGSLGRADALVVTRRTATQEQAASLASRLWMEHGPFDTCAIAFLEPGGWSGIQGGGADAPQGPVLAAAGIARPEAFAEVVRRTLGVDVELIAFPDHHRYDTADVSTLRSRAGGRTLVVTEKDAVKLAPLARDLEPVRVLELVVRWDAGEAELRDLIARRISRSP